MTEDFRAASGKQRLAALAASAETSCGAPAPSCADALSPLCDTSTATLAVHVYVEHTLHWRATRAASFAQPDLISNWDDS